MKCNQTICIYSGLEVINMYLFRLTITLRKTITQELDNEIKVEGNRNYIMQLRDSIYPSVRTNFHWNGDEHAEFNMGLWNLQKKINGYSVAQIFLNFIEKNQLPINERTKYLLQYWAFEVEMINKNNSYRSKFAMHELTFPDKINTILDRCKTEEFLPSPEHLFNLFENSMKGNTSSCRQPLMPYEYEIQAFVKSTKTSFSEIRKASRILAQGYRDTAIRDNFCLFSTLPDEINIKIASHSGNSLVHDESSATKIASSNYFNKP